MKRRSAQVGYLIPLALASYPVEAANLDVRVESGGAAAITVAPDDPIPFEVIGPSDTNNGGLAGFALKLCLQGGTLEPAETPSADPMKRRRTRPVAGRCDFIHAGDPWGARVVASSRFSDPRGNGRVVQAGQSVRKKPPGRSVMRTSRRNENCGLTMTGAPATSRTG